MWSGAGTAAVGAALGPTLLCPEKHYTSPASLEVSHCTIPKVGVQPGPCGWAELAKQMAKGHSSAPVTRDQAPEFRPGILLVLRVITL